MSRVFFVNRFFYPDQSATAQLLSDLAFALTEAGFDVHVVCSRQLYGRPRADLAASEIIRGVRVQRVSATRFGRDRLLGRAADYTSFYVTSALALVASLRRGDVIVAETDPPLISLIALLAARLRGAALVNWLQDVFPEVATRLGASPLSPLLDRLLRRLRDASLRAARSNVVLGARMRDYVAGRVDKSNCCIIENWADDGGVVPIPVGSSDLRRRLGLTDRFVVGYSGNLGRAHEFETLLGAARLLPATTGIAFLFIGGGRRLEELKARVARERLEHFHFLPYQSRDLLSDTLAAADVHWVSLLPSLEGLIVPSKFYGILAAGRPTIFVGDEDGELARVIAETGCGVTIRAGDSSGLAQAIDGLRTDPRRARAMGLAARQLLCARYGMPRAIERWIRLLSEIQTQGPRGRPASERAERSRAPPRSAR